MKKLVAWKAANPGAVGPLAKKLIWSGLRATSFLRVLPDFLIIGAQKCGTTSLYFQLANHPQVVASLKKETSYFGENATRTVAWYRSHFPLAFTRNRTAKRSGQASVFEASTCYCFHPQAARAAASTVPNAKLILLVRDPVARAISHYHHNVAKNLESLSMQDAFDIAFNNFDSDLANWQQACDEKSHYVEPERAYLLRGMYDLQIKNWLNHFKESQLKIVAAEDMWFQPVDTFQSILDFLGLESWTPVNFEAANQRPYGRASEKVLDQLSEFYSQSSYRWNKNTDTKSESSTRLPLSKTVAKNI